MSLRSQTENYVKRTCALKQSPKTTENSYRRALLSFVSYAERHGVYALSEVIRELIENYQIEQACLNSRNTAIYRTRLVVQFLTNCFENGDISLNPAKGIRILKKEKKLPKVMSDAEFDCFLFTPIRLRKKEWLTYLHRAVISVLGYTGLRRSELLDLCLPDIDLESRTLLVRRGKGGKPRLLALHESVVLILNDYLRQRPKAKNDFLFLSPNGRVRLGKNSLYDLYKRHLRRCHLENKGFTLHTIRHSVATRIFRRTKNLAVVQRILGHESLDSTQIYLHVSADDIKAAIDCAF